MLRVSQSYIWSVILALQLGTTSLAAADLFSGQWTGTWHNSLKNSGTTKLTLAVKGYSITGVWDDVPVENVTRNGQKLTWEAYDKAHQRQYWFEFEVIAPDHAKLTYRAKSPTREYSGWVDDYTLAPASSQKPLSVSISPAQHELESGEKVSTGAEVTGGEPPYTYEWHNGDRKSELVGSRVSWTVRGAGTRDIKVQVTDAAGHTAEAHSQIVVRAAEENKTVTQTSSGATSPQPKPEPVRRSTQKPLEEALQETRARSAAALEKFPALRVGGACANQTPNAPWGQDAKEMEGAVRIEEYRGLVSHALRNFRTIYGKLSAAEAAGLDKMWAPFYDNPTPAAAAWFARLNPLVDEYIASAAMLEGSFPAFQSAMSNAVIAMGTRSRTVYAASAPAAALHYQRIDAARKRLGELAKAVAALGEAPNPLAARCAARARHAKALGGASELWTLLHRSVYAAAGQGGQNDEFGEFRLGANLLKVSPDLKWNGTEFSYSATIPDDHPGCGGTWRRTELQGELSKDGTQVRSLSGTMTWCSCLASKGDNGECERFGPKQATLRFPGASVALYQDKPVLGGPERVRVLFTNASRALELDPKPSGGVQLLLPAARVQEGDVYLQFTNYLVNDGNFDKWLGGVTRVVGALSGGGKPSDQKSQTPDVVVSAPTSPVPASSGGVDLAPPEQAQAMAEAIAEHEAIARQDQDKAARWAADAQREKDPKIREELEKRAREAAANASAERDIANSLRTGTLVRTRTEWDQAQETAMVNGIHQELAQFDWESHQIDAISRALPNMDPAQAKIVQDRMEAALQSPNHVQEMVRLVERQGLEQTQNQLVAAQYQALREQASAETQLEVVEGIQKACSAVVMIGALAVPGAGPVALYHSLGTGLIEGGVSQMLENGVRLYSPYVDVAFAAYEGAVRKDPKTGAYGGAWGAVTNAAWTAATNAVLNRLAPRLQGAVEGISGEAAGMGSRVPAPEIEGFQSTEWRHQKAREQAKTQAELDTIDRQFDTIVQRKQMKEELADAVAAADKQAAAARRPDGSVDTTHPAYQSALNGLRERTVEIRSEYAKSENRASLHAEALESAGLKPGDVVLSGGNPRNASSDMDVAAATYAAGKAYVSRFGRGLHVVEYGDRWVISNDTTVWKPSAEVGVGSSSYEAQVIHGAMRGSDKFATQAGVDFTKGKATADKLGAVIDNVKKAGEAGLGGDAPEDLHVIGKSLDKAMEISGVKSVPGLRERAAALRGHQLPEEIGIVTLGASPDFKKRQLKSFLNTARRGMDDSFQSAMADSAALETGLIASKQSALRTGDIKTASAIQRQLAIIRLDNRLAVSTIADSSPGLMKHLLPPEGTVTKPGTPPEPAKIGWTPLLKWLQADGQSEGKVTLPHDSNDPALKSVAERCKTGAASVDQKLRAAKPGTDEAKHLAALKSVLLQGVTDPAAAIQETRQLTGYELAEVLHQLGVVSGK